MTPPTVMVYPVQPRMETGFLNMATEMPAASTPLALPSTWSVKAPVRLVTRKLNLHHRPLSLLCTHEHGCSPWTGAHQLTANASRAFRVSSSTNPAPPVSGRVRHVLPRSRAAELLFSHWLCLAHI